MLGKFLAESFGTFIFLGIVITSEYAIAKENDKLRWLKRGFALSVAILLIGFISLDNLTPDLNPAVSFMLYLNNDIDLPKLSTNILGQITGAILAYFYYLYLKKIYSKSSSSSSS
jgi:glycerol uptake facilitator-like aquaporin